MFSSKKLLLSVGAGLLMSCGADTSSGNIKQEPDRAEIRSLGQSVLADCPYTSPVINLDKELVVRDLTVVNDKCRTEFNGTGCVSTPSKGKWSFVYLMSQIAGNTDAAGTSEFILKWLNTWKVDQIVNGHLVQPRHNIDKVINAWRSASACSSTGPCILNFNEAPFRLLAIVNRIDLSGTAAYGTSPTDNPGELRFVFGFIDRSKISNPDPSVKNGALSATVILEYKLTPHMDTFGWADVWHRLALKSGEDYNSALENLTNKVTTYNTSMIPGGSALAQLRTNELEFDSASLSSRVWELREMKRQCTPAPCILRLDTVKETPDIRYNNGGLPGTPYEGALDAYLLANQAKIDHEDLSTLPASMLGGASRSRGPLGSQFTWTLSTTAESNYEDQGGGFKMLTRHKFGLQTCNGCHYAETGTVNFHIGPRAILTKAPLSQFVAPSDALASSADSHFPANFFEFADPRSGEPRQYNDAWRRKCEFQRLLNFGSIPLFKPSGAH
ncbi:hypothetical protein F0U59_29855 [Archangium gephyra]|nr:hypothetical protein F0U59_29855 [Archangium gephyra]